ncbi:peptidase C65 Otubain-domain-containing protein [Aspergillus cavernicola]|uniref:ubiquitinyl hydrolase 1 n=1 Tax=Aspergillus cavernicola TaxID=176166 RepID=A0ABR4ITU9_9EURO
MSLSDLPRNHFDPLNHFPPREEPALPDFYSQLLSPPAFIGHGISQLSSALCAHHPTSIFNMNALSPEEMERYQELSNKFEPELPGPLVSHKQSTNFIAMEYANADATFSTKTTALAVTHPQSRIMKGDGNCGWRAVAFGYFEHLFNLRDTLQAHRELVRIKSLNTLLDQVGQQEHLYEIFVDATEEVFESITGAIERGQRDDSFLVELFNDEYNSNAIITHFRLLTSAWMKLNPHRYQAFLSMPLDQYCATRIETVKTEIDEVGLQGLVDGVIEGSGLMVEILYLDRSEGDAVTSHVLTQTRPGIGSIRLLYRPGHYDLLYQVEPTVNMQPVVNFQYAMTSDYEPWDTSDLSFDVNPGLMAIPNLMMDTSFALTPPMSQPPSDPYRVSPPHEVYHPPVHTPPPAPITSPPPPIRLSGPPPIMNSLPPRSNDGPQIRLNPLVMKPNLSHSLPVTAPFKNSPYNQAHFQNSDFEPIHWEPHESRK